jgi:hypothetical protein
MSATSPAVRSGLSGGGVEQAGPAPARPARHRPDRQLGHVLDVRVIAGERPAVGEPGRPAVGRVLDHRLDEDRVLHAEPVHGRRAEHDEVGPERLSVPVAERLDRHLAGPVEPAARPLVAADDRVVRVDRLVPQPRQRADAAEQHDPPDAEQRAASRQFSDPSTFTRRASSALCWTAAGLPIAAVWTIASGFASRTAAITSGQCSTDPWTNDTGRPSA